ncbi:MAG: PepSY1/2 domain-containing protein [Christensenellales bacterium]
MKKITIIITSVVLGIVGTVAGTILYFGKVNEANDYKSKLEYVYQQNFYELVDNVNNIESNLSKLTVSTDATQQNDYLSKVSTLANSAQNNISVLPIEHNAINDTITYLNQLGGYTSTLQEGLVSQKEIDMDQMSQLEDLLSTSKTVKKELNKLSVMISSENYSIVDNLSDPNRNASKFNSEWANFNNGTIEYPQLIYDGPFSDSVIHKEVKGLSDKEMTEAEVSLKMKDWFADSKITYVGKTSGGDFATYNYNLKKGDNEYYAQVSVRDGILLQFNSGQVSNALNHTEEECCTFAQEFAKKLGLENLEVVWSTESDNFTYVNLAPIQNNVILYPDEIKVKVSNTTGEVIGCEAKSWAYNHTTRTDLSATITKAEAQKSVSASMDIRSSRLVVVPDEFAGETLCWEFMCVYDGSTYYVYINAKTGLQAQILKVVETDDGNLLM